MNTISRLSVILKFQDLDQMTVFELTDIAMKKGVDLSSENTFDEIRDILVALKKERKAMLLESQKGCGINRDANPCGDASDY